MGARQTNVFWYGAGRGLDGFKRRKIVYMVGNPLPPSGAIDEAAVAMNIGEPRNFQLAQDGYVRSESVAFAANGSMQNLPKMSHPDPYGEVVLRQKVDAEIGQMIDRLRLIFNTETKGVVMLTGIPVEGVVVDEFVTWDAFMQQQKPEVLALNSLGFVPFSYRAMERVVPQAFETTQESLIHFPIYNTYRETDQTSAGKGISAQTLHRAAERADKIRKVWHMPTELGALGVIARGAWFNITIRHTASDSEKQPRAFQMLGTAPTAEVMEMSVRSYYETTPFEIAEIQISPAMKDPQYVLESLAPTIIAPQLANSIADDLGLAMPAGQMMSFGDFGIQPLLRELLPERLRGVEQISTRPLVTASDAQSWILDANGVTTETHYLLDLTFRVNRVIGKKKKDGTPKFVEEFVDTIAVMYLTRKLPTEAAAIREADLRDLEVYLTSEILSERFSGASEGLKIDSGSTKRVIGVYGCERAALQAVERDWAPYFDHMDGIYLSDELRAAMELEEGVVGEVDLDFHRDPLEGAPIWYQEGLFGYTLEGSANGPDLDSCPDFDLPPLEAYGG